MTQSDDQILSSLLTMRDWLRWAASRFAEARLVFGHGTANALDEAAFIILSTLHLPVDQLEPWLEARLTPDERQALLDVIRRRIETRKPAPYLIGAAYIQGHRFIVDERVIVPRSYLGELICQVGDGGGLEPVLPPVIDRVLDLCTGSGCLAVLAALAFPGAQVDAADVSADALAVAALNVEAHDVADRVQLLRGDLFEAITSARGGRLPTGESPRARQDHRGYDLILANPPYVAGAEVAAFAPEYAAEPVLAHLGGADGLDLVRRILAEAARHLSPDGVLVMEIGTGRAFIEAELPALPFLWLDTETSEGEVLAIRRADLQGNTTPSGTTQRKTTLGKTTLGKTTLGKTTLGKTTAGKSGQRKTGEG